LRLLTKQLIPAITLIELLVVIAVLGILAAVVAPNIGGWNCRQEVRNDFNRLNIFLETLRSEAVNRNSTMMLEVHKYGTNAIIKAYQGPQSRKKICWSNGGWNYLGNNDVMDYGSKDSNLSNTRNSKVCFNPDGSATSINYEITRQCDKKNYKFRNQIFGTTGFIEKLKYNLTSKKWDEL